MPFWYFSDLYVNVPFSTSIKPVCCTHMQTERAGNVRLGQRDGHTGDIGVLQPRGQQLRGQQLVQPSQILDVEGQQEHHAGLAPPQRRLQDLHHVFYVFMVTEQTWRGGQRRSQARSQGEKAETSPACNCFSRCSRRLFSGMLGQTIQLSSHLVSSPVKCARRDPTKDIIFTLNCKWLHIIRLNKAQCIPPLSFIAVKAKIHSALLLF